MLHDFRSALRWIARRPGLVSVSVASLGLGIGANVAVFSVIDAFLFRPFPVLEPERLVEVQSRTAEGELGGVSAPDYFDFVELGSDRFPLAARMGFVLNVRVGDVTERLEGAFVSSSYFDVLGVPPAIGRGFSADEDQTPAPIAVISHRLWRTRFEESPNVLGQTVRLNGRDLTIVGIAPAGFRGIRLPAETDFWVPLPMIETLWPTGLRYYENRAFQTLAVYLRLAPGTSLEEARAAFIVHAAALEQAYPETNQGRSASEPDILLHRITKWAAGMGGRLPRHGTSLSGNELLISLWVNDCQPSRLAVFSIRGSGRRLTDLCIRDVAARREVAALA